MNKDELRITQQDCERLSRILGTPVSNNTLSIHRKMQQLYNMYPDRPIETWDIKHAEEMFLLEMEINHIRNFENT